MKGGPLRLRKGRSFTVAQLGDGGTLHYSVQPDRSFICFLCRHDEDESIPIVRNVNGIHSVCSDMKGAESIFAVPCWIKKQTPGWGGKAHKIKTPRLVYCARPSSFVPQKSMEFTFLVLCNGFLTRKFSTSWRGIFVVLSGADGVIQFLSVANEWMVTKTRWIIGMLRIALVVVTANLFIRKVTFALKK